MALTLMSDERTELRRRVRGLEIRSEEARRARDYEAATAKLWCGLSRPSPTRLARFVNISPSLQQRPESDPLGLSQPGASN